ncbi:FK506-binding protein 15 isoform X2 [Thalassophryne amazonica]|uniref:FK506-binding protein 15 isoform X2 n=1 Tax=Thalassophryne amazonica TaxID=390379 RepID=UPI001472318D|nr:FK506-binding protein 15 isoform X2 [Thalassophryne amazonica]
MFGGDDEDGDFLSPTGGAKLASLFGVGEETSQGNESFQYTAPKQPRKTSNSAPTQKPSPAPGAPAVLSATAVQAFRYINGQYVKQGKLGAAVLGNHTSKEYQLLLYMSQQKQVTSAKIHVGFVFTVQPNNYCTFYDDQRQNWSLMFESEKVSSDFCKEVCLAKANSSPSLDVVVIQDVSLGESQAVENGDSLEVAYTGWLLQNHAVGQMFDSNQNKGKLLRLKLGAGKVIKGWEEGMLGMKKSGRRVIVIPPNLAYGSKGVPNRIPANSTLIFEAELRRVKFYKDSGSDQASLSSRDSVGPSPVSTPAPSVENLASVPPAEAAVSEPGRTGEASLRVKSNSLSEQLANPDATKAKLISRMAKMGQPMLPFITGVPSQLDSSDSELEDTSGCRMKDVPAAPSPVQISMAASTAAQVHHHHHPHTAPPSALVPLMTTIPHQPGLPSNAPAFQPYSQTSVAPSPLQPVGQICPTHTVPYMGSGDVTSFLMTEARQHNTEIRLAVGKVADKVDQLASRLDGIQSKGNLSVGISGMSMETSLIMHNIERIIQENECLKKEVFEKSSRIDDQNRKIGDLINQNQRYMEKSNLLLEQRNDSLKSSSEQNQARLLQAEQDKLALHQDLGFGQVRLTEDLAASTARLSQLQLEASAHQQKAVELQTKLSSVLQDNENHCQRITVLEKEVEELNETAERTQAQYHSEKQRRKEMELKVINIEEEVQDLKTDKDHLERMLSERKKKWQMERQRRDEEMEEVRRNSQQEQDNLRAQLYAARSSSGNAASEQLCQLQADLEEAWKKKCERALASAKEQHVRELTEVTEQKDALKDQLTQLQEKFTVLKQSRDSEEQVLLQHQVQNEELQTLQEKYTTLEQQEEALREKLQRRVAELETNLAEQQRSSDTAAEVKRVMNGVFHSLRAEFDLSEYYSGQVVLRVIVNTIKNVTLQLLSDAGKSPPTQVREKENVEEEDEENEVKHQTEELHQNVNGDGGTGEEEKEGEHSGDLESQQPDKVQMEEEVTMEMEAPITTESVTQSQSEASHGHLVSGTESAPQETPGTESAPQETPDTESAPQETPDTESAPQETPVTGMQHEQEPQCEPSEESSGVSCESPDSNEVTESSPPDGNAAVSDEVVEGDAEGEQVTASEKVFAPPANPPPLPQELPQTTAEVPEPTKETPEENGEELFFEVPTPTKRPAAPSVEEEEDELNLKGRPPPTPLFGDEDDDDLDWMN